MLSTGLRHGSDIRMQVISSEPNASEALSVELQTAINMRRKKSLGLNKRANTSRVPPSRGMASILL